jgi:hypothetical protein
MKDRPKHFAVAWFLRLELTQELIALQLARKTDPSFLRETNGYIRASKLLP